MEIGEVCPINLKRRLDVPVPRIFESIRKSSGDPPTMWQRVFDESGAGRGGLSSSVTPQAFQPGQAFVPQVSLDNFDSPAPRVEQPEIEDQRRNGDREWTHDADYANCYVVAHD
jgi:hypothetical protein